MGVGTYRLTTRSAVARPWGFAKYQAAIPATTIPKTTRHATARARFMAPSEEKDPVSLPPCRAAWKSLPGRRSQFDGGRLVDHLRLSRRHHQDDSSRLYG